MKTMKPKITLLLIGVLLFALLMIVVIIQSKRGTGKTLSIGADITLTGKFGYFGQQFQKGLKLAETEFGNKEGEVPVKILIQDNRHNAGEANSIFEKFTNVDSVCAITTLYSPMSNALKDLAVQHRIPLVTTYTTAKNITNEWTFRDFPTMDMQIPKLIQLLYNDLGKRTASCILFQSDFGHDGRDIFDSLFALKGGRILQNEEVPMEGSEEIIQNVVAKVTANKPECVFLVLSANTLGVAVKKLRESNYHGEIASVVMFDSPEVHEIAGKYAEGVYFSGIPIDFSHQDAKKLIAACKSNYGEMPDYMVVYGYTMGKYMIAVARESKGNRELFKTGMKKPDIPSLRGRLLVNPDNSILSPVGLYRAEKSGNKPIGLKIK